MHRYQLAIGKADILRKRFIAGEYNSYALAKELKVSTKTTWMYKREFEHIRAVFPDKLGDFGFYPGEPRRPHWATQKYNELMLMLPVLVTGQTTLRIEPRYVYDSYAQQSTHTYKYPTFKPLLFQWLKDNFTPVKEILLDKINTADLRILKSWRNGNNHRLWQIAKCLDLANRGLTLKELSFKLNPVIKVAEAGCVFIKLKG